MGMVGQNPQYKELFEMNGTILKTTDTYEYQLTQGNSSTPCHT